MCNKRIPASNFNAISIIKSIFLPPAAVILFIVQGCAGERDYLERSETLLENYPVAVEAIVQRDFERLLRLTDAPDPELSALAWRAIAKTGADEGEVEILLNKVMTIDTDAAWFALSFHEPGEDQMDRVREQVRDGEIESAAVCELFFRHGGRVDLEYLLSARHLHQKPACAKAVGGILTRVESPESLNQAVVALAFEAEEKEIRRNLLYGYYRAALNRPQPETGYFYDASRIWQEFGIGRDEFTDMTMVRMLGEFAFRKVMAQMSDADLDQRPGLSIDLASSLETFTPDSTDDELLFRLLQHQNPNIPVRVLVSLAQHEHTAPPLLDRIEEEITIRTRNAGLFVASLDLLLKNGREISSYRHKLDMVSGNEPYLTDRFLSVYAAIEEDSAYLDRLESAMENGGVVGLHAARKLSEFSRKSGLSRRTRERVGQIVHEALDRGNRSVLDGLTQLLMDEQAAGEYDYNRLNQTYQTYLDTGRPESAEILGRIMEERFSGEFNREQTAVGEKPFRLPDTDRLYEMGTRPFWTLETDKGTIVVRLDPLTAPFTVSSIDSLTRAGAYDGVVFHRVVSNFVAQGGDFDRRDGFGGPGYRLPTEPSTRTFERGMAGIASSGTDTEGSQFFFMHRWAPHLDGHYTLFGEITRGLDVMDRLQVGDRVIHAGIYPE